MYHIQSCSVIVFEWQYSILSVSVMQTDEFQNVEADKPETVGDWSQTDVAASLVMFA